MEYVYQRPVDGLKLIESGDWLAGISNNKSTPPSGGVVLCDVLAIFFVTFPSFAFLSGPLSILQSHKKLCWR